MTDQDEPTDPPTLNYRPPDPRGSRYPGVAVGGFLLAVALQGCVAVIPYWSIQSSPSGNGTRWPMLLAFAVVETGAVTGMILMRRRKPFSTWAYFFFGLLLGTGVTALIEGACFIAT